MKQTIELFFKRLKLVQGHFARRTKAKHCEFPIIFKLTTHFKGCQRQIRMKLLKVHILKKFVPSTIHVGGGCTALFDLDRMHVNPVAC